MSNSRRPYPGRQHDVDSIGTSRGRDVGRTGRLVVKKLPAILIALAILALASAVLFAVVKGQPATATVDPHATSKSRSARTSPQ